MSVVEDIVAGDVRAAARLMRDLDDQMPGAAETLKELYPHTGGGRIIGVTGNPGSGKSSLVNALIAGYREQGRRVGVVAIDPSSPFSGGAILGDRIRMQRHALDDGVFIRSLASRGHLGGLSRSANDIITVFDAMGFDVILVETVGVGQAEVDIVDAAHLSIVVVVPGLGDEVQAMKAGILEIADVLCVNKSDRPEAFRTLQDLRQMLTLRSPDLPKPEIVSTVAINGEGILELIQQLEQSIGDQQGEQWQRRLIRRARKQLEELLTTGAARVVHERCGEDLNPLIDQIARREVDPYTVAERLIARSFSK